MRASLLSVACLFCLAQAAASPDVFAQSASPDPQLVQARARFEEGIKFYDAGKYEQARVAFLQTYTLKQDSGVLLNLALSCHKSGHILDAQRYFKRFLNDAPKASANERTTATNGLNEAQAALGHIEVTAPAKGTIVVDGTEVGAAPLAEAVPVDPGDHAVTLKTPDGIAQTQHLTVHSGENVPAHFKDAGVSPAESAPAPAAAHAEAPATKENGPETGSSLLTPPRNLVPVIALGGVAIVGYAVAIGLFVAEGSAHDNVHRDEAFIRANAPAGASAVNCSSNPPSNLASACHALISDNNAANTDAVVGGIALGVGIAATVGGVVYWVLADKDKGPAKTGAVVYPLVGSGTGGLAVAGRF
jgi:hypothetical protein